MNKVKILWSGITGRTGKEALEVVKSNDSFEIVAGICRSDNKYYNYEQLDNITEDFDVIIDFSHKDSFNKVLNYAIRMNKPLIIGTAGLSDEQVEALENASNIIPIFRGGNFRFEVKQFIDEIVEYAKTCADDLVLIETHYKTINIPSETAKVIARRVLEETGKKVEIKSFLQNDENTNDWRVDNIHYRCGAYDEKLAKDILNIAVMIKDKTPNGIYDLDRLIKEYQESL